MLIRYAAVRFASVFFLILSLTLLSFGCGENREQVTSNVDPVQQPERALTEAGNPPPPLNFDWSLNAGLDTLTFTWNYNNPGDYNVDGIVSGLDVFPLASRFNQESNYNGHTSTTDGNDCIDGNMDGTLNGLDLFVCAANFQTRVDGWNIYRDAVEDGTFDSPITMGPVEYMPEPCGTVQDYATAFEQGESWWYAARSVDEDAATEGELSPVFKPLYWQVETVDAEDRVGQFTSLAFGLDGNPAVAYFDVTNSDLKFARFDGTDWQVEIVDAPGYVGEFCSLAFGGDGHPAISYQDNDNVSLKFARWDGSAWQIETVDPGGNLGEYTSLAFSPTGEPTISYIDRGNADLKLARFNGTAWDIETVDGFANAEYDTTLVFAPDGHPAICYYEGNPTYGPKYARFDGMIWQTRWLGSQFGYQPSMAFAPDGQPSVACYTSVDLKYTHYDGAAWQTEIVESPGASMQHPSLAFDPGGSPVITYFVNSPHLALRLARHNGTAWDILTIDGGGDDYVGQYNSLAFGPDGHPAISYYDATNGDLKIARYR